MTLPVSSYEELLETVRSLNQETRQLQRHLSTPIGTQNSSSGKFHKILLGNYYQKHCTNG